MRAREHQIGGDHYKTMSMQPIEFIQSNRMGFCEGSVIKYLCRRKGSRMEDLQKARHYIELMQEDRDYIKASNGRGWRFGITAADFAKINELDAAAAAAIGHIYFWNITGHAYHLDGAWRWVNEIIGDLQGM